MLKAKLKLLFTPATVALCLGALVLGFLLGDSPIGAYGDKWARLEQSLKTGVIQLPLELKRELGSYLYNYRKIGGTQELRGAIQAAEQMSLDFPKYYYW